MSNSEPYFMYVLRDLAREGEFIDDPRLWASASSTTVCMDMKISESEWCHQQCAHDEKLMEITMQNEPDIRERVELAESIEEMIQADEKMLGYM